MAIRVHAAEPVRQLGATHLDLDGLQSHTLGQQQPRNRGAARLVSQPRQREGELGASAILGTVRGDLRRRHGRELVVIRWQLAAQRQRLEP